ncbi:MAG: DUF427 domain-containing protein [Bacteroidota bacterium]
MINTPKWIKEAREKWAFRGQKRPDFAIEPKPGQESVWDYPRPPIIVPDPRTVRVQLHHNVISESNQAVSVKETASAPVFYIPPQHIRMEWLIRSERETMCEWKGIGTYWHVKIEDQVLMNVAWSYERPFPEFESIKGWISFYPALLDCFVGEEQVRPQPGGFYGGWVTSEIVGPIKGEPGSGGW